MVRVKVCYYEVQVLNKADINDAVAGVETVLVLGANRATEAKKAVKAEYDSTTIKQMVILDVKKVIRPINVGFAETIADAIVRVRRDEGVEYAYTALAGTITDADYYDTPDDGDDVANDADAYDGDVADASNDN